MSTIALSIDREARLAPERTALRFRGRSISYGALSRRSIALARQLSELGIGSGAPLGILMGNRPEWITSAVAAARVGALLFPISTFLREGELARLLRDAAVETVIHSPSFSGVRYRELLSDIAKTEGTERCLLEWREDDELPTTRGSVRERRRPVPAGPDDAAIVFHTSGSTGEPKGVLHSHGPMVRHARAIADRMGIDRGDRSWSTFPLFFSAGTMIFAWSGLVVGATLVLQEKFEPGEALHLLGSERCTVYQGWPHQLEAMMSEPRFRETDLSLLQKSNGAKFLPHDAFLRRPHRAIDGWGMSETLTYCCSTRWTDAWEVRHASHGRPLDGVEIRVVDPDSGRTLEAGEEGELRVRGYNVMRGYLGAPRASHLDRDGYFRSGDLGRIDEKGDVHFLGRLKDVIKTAGVNVSAVEIENLLGAHPAVEAVYVVGIPDRSRGEVIAAFVVPSGPCVESELQEFVRARTAGHKVPRRVHFVTRDDLPQTDTGKVLKPRLREMAIARGAMPH